MAAAAIDEGQLYLVQFLDTRGARGPDSRALSFPLILQMTLYCAADAGVSVVGVVQSLIMRIFNYDARTTHVGFADEAYWNDGLFRSVACISARVEDYPEIEQRFCMARCTAGAKVSEVKWSGLNDHDRRREAEALLLTTVDLATARKLRIDVIIWNHLERQALAKRRNTDEGVAIWNLRNMYRTLFGFVLKRWRATEGTGPLHWTFGTHYPEGLNRNMLEQHTRRFGALPGTRVDIRRAKSMLNYSVQLADLLAGMGAYSHDAAEDYRLWLQQGKPRSFRLGARNARDRFPVLDAFHGRCTGNQGVLLLRNKPGWQGQGLWTRNPRHSGNSINFWPYTLQNP